MVSSEEMSALTGNVNVAVPSAANGFIEAARRAQAGAVGQATVNAKAEARLTPKLRRKPEPNRQTSGELRCRSSFIQRYS
jgi:hypothetical protein